MVAMPELPGALAYRSTQPGQSPYRVTMIVGPEVVQLNLCECSSTTDHVALVRKWATTVADSFRHELEDSLSRFRTGLSTQAASPGTTVPARSKRQHHTRTAPPPTNRQAMTTERQ